MAYRYWLEHGGRRYELSPGTTLIGRSDACHVLLDDALVSRQHARIFVEGETARIEDAGSSNGVFVNGNRVMNSGLADGDAIAIGNQRFILRRGAGPGRRRAHTMMETAHGPERDGGERTSIPEDVSTSQRDPLELLAPVIDKTLALGRVDEAERLVGPHLQRLLDRMRKQPRASSDTERAVTYAAQLAELTRAPRWIDYCFELYTLLQVPLPGTVVEQLYTTLRNVPGVSRAKHKTYVQVLSLEAARLGPRERFLVQRIGGLSKIIR